MGDTEAMREALADAILSLRSEANLASRAGQHDRLHAIADSLNAASRAALAALPASEPTLTGEETVNWYGLLRSAAAILPEVETPERLLVAARNVAADIDAALAPYPTSFDLPAAAPVPEGVPEDRLTDDEREGLALIDWWWDHGQRVSTPSAFVTARTSEVFDIIATLRSLVDRLSDTPHEGEPDPWNFDRTEGDEDGDL